MTPSPAWPAFDEEVIRAMAKWPDVPRCFGWLALDRRGAWRIRGEVIRHARTVAFLSRHYRVDDSGCWYVQNGPQQVFVDLDYTPWVYRYQPDGSFSSHTGIAAGDLDAVYVDDDGNLLLLATLGIGVLDDRDLEACSSLLDTSDDGSPRSLRWRNRRLPLRTIARAQVGAAFRFEPHPHAGS